MAPFFTSGECEAGWRFADAGLGTGIVPGGASLTPAYIPGTVPGGASLTPAYIPGPAYIYGVWLL
jgi:hypothetical protein